MYNISSFEGRSTAKYNIILHFTDCDITTRVSVLVLGDIFLKSGYG